MMKGLNYTDNPELSELNEYVELEEKYRETLIKLQQSQKNNHTLLNEIESHKKTIRAMREFILWAKDEYLFDEYRGFCYLSLSLSRDSLKLCPNCDQENNGLYLSETGVNHCGCYHNGDPLKIRKHISNDPLIKELNYKKATEYFWKNVKKYTLND